MQFNGRGKKRKNISNSYSAMCQHKDLTAYDTNNINNQSPHTRAYVRSPAHEKTIKMAARSARGYTDQLQDWKRKRNFEET